MTARWIAPGLLVAVACTQIALAKTTELSPWLGGGFGMFATIDSRGDRHLAITAESPGLVRELGVPESLEDHAERVRAWPTEARLEAFAHAVARESAERVPGLNAVRVQLWHSRRAPRTLEYDEVLAREVRVEVP